MKPLFAPEWTPHKAVWLAWPSDQKLRGEDLPRVQKEFTAFCHAIVHLDPKTEQPHGETIHLLTDCARAKEEAQKALSGLPVRFFDISYGDIWLRDTAPLFLEDGAGQKSAAVFKFNGWGEKYVLKHDQQVAERVAAASGKKYAVYDLILEGGSIEVDEFGTLLTTEQCLLNPNRNPKMSKNEIESTLRKALQVQKMLWIKEGLLNDHTDGHIDTIVRFAPDNKVICMKAKDSKDPNRAVLDQIIDELSKMKNAAGKNLDLIEVPSPGKIMDDDGKIMPASYVNFYISNTRVIVPTYGSQYDDEAVKTIQSAFPNRNALGLPAKSILLGGGAFHCISQQEPAGD